MRTIPQARLILPRDVPRASADRESLADGWTWRKARFADLPELMAIEREAFPVLWSEEEFARVIGGEFAGDWCTVVAEAVAAIGKPRRRPLLGYLCVSGHRLRSGRWVEYLRAVAVRQDWRRRHVGKTLLSLVGRRSGVALVRERHLPAQLFLRSCGWRCVGYHDRAYSQLIEGRVERPLRFVSWRKT